MKVLIIEDENLAAQRLEQLLKSIVPDIQIFGNIDTVTGAIKHLSTIKDYDIIFLDIQLADGKSFTIFDYINVSIPVIFITAFDEYAIKAFEINSIDYLLKPINEDKLRTAINKLYSLKNYYSPSQTLEWQQLMKTFQVASTKNYKNRFLVNKADTLLAINSDKIAYFVAQDKEVTMYTLDNEHFFVNYSLDDLEQKLDPKMFFRVNRQYLCSISAIKKAHSFFNYKLNVELSPKTDEQVIVSKTKSTEFKAWLNDERE